MKPTWNELRTRSMGVVLIGGKEFVTYCTLCYFMFRAGAVDGRGWGCAKHTLPGEVDERDRDVNGGLARSVA